MPEEFISSGVQLTYISPGLRPKVSSGTFGLLTDIYKSKVLKTFDLSNSVVYILIPYILQRYVLAKEHLCRLKMYFSQSWYILAPYRGAELILRKGEHFVNASYDKMILPVRVLELGPYRHE